MAPGFEDHLKATLAEIEADGLTKRERLIAGPQGGRITIEGKDGPRSVINLLSLIHI